MDIGSLTGTIALEDELSGALTIVASKVKQFASGFEGAFGTIAIGAAGAATAIAGITGSIIALGNRGSDVNDVTATFENFSGSVGRAEENLKALREGTLGTVDDFDLMKASSKLLAAGVKLTSDNFGTLSSAAFVLQNQGLGPTKDMLDLVSQALLTGRTRALEMKIGKIDLAKAERDYAASLGVEKLTRMEKLEADRIGILEAMSRKVKEAGVQNRDFGEQMEAAVVAVKNWGDELASAVAKPSHVTGAVSAIGDALVKAFGGAGKTLTENIVYWINKFADAVANYGPKIIQSMVDIAKKIREIYDQILSAWDTAPDWFKAIAKEALIAGVAVGSVQLATQALTGQDTLSNVASLATIWAGFGGAISKVNTAIKELLALRIGWLAWAGAIAGGIGTITTAIVTPPLFIAGLFTAGIAPLYQVGVAFSNLYETWKSGKSMWDSFAAKEDDNFVRRALGWSKGIDAVSKSIEDLHLKGSVTGTDTFGFQHLNTKEDTKLPTLGRVEGVTAGDVLGMGGNDTERIDAAAKALEEYRKKIKALADELPGKVIVKAADDMIKSLKQAGPIAQMTEAHIKQINDVMAAARDVFHAWGQDVPDDIRAAYEATFRLTDQIPLINKWKDSLAHSADGLLTLTPIADHLANTTWPKTIKGIESYVNAVENARQPTEDLHAVWNNTYKALGNVSTILDAIPGKFAEVASMAARAGQAIMSNLAEGNVVGAVVAGVTAGIGIITKLVGIGPTEYEKRMKAAVTETKNLQDALVKSHRSMSQLIVDADIVGINIKEAFKWKDPEAFKNIVDELEGKTQLLNSAMQEYGFTWQDLGEKARTAKLGELFDDLFAKTDILRTAGIDYATILERQAGDYSDLVQKAIRTGTEIPAAMQPVLQDLIDMGKLVDENGVAFTDLSKVKWAESLTAGFDKVTDAIDRLADALLNGVGGAMDVTSNKKVVINTEYQTTGYPPSEQQPQYAAAGGKALAWRPRGTDTVPAMLTPGETVAPAGRNEQPITINNTIKMPNNEVLAKQIVKTFVRSGL